jgi:hypothetical protein
MNNSDQRIFIILFREACKKCFGHDLTAALSETESKQLSTTIFDATGLVIGVKSIKNYSQFVTGSGRQENPSIATLDTLARYVMDAPTIDETIRKDREPHHPYWFEYKRNQPRASSKRIVQIIAVVSTIILVAVTTYYYMQQKPQARFVEDFNSVDDASLTEHGWKLISKDPSWWEKRSAREGHITLYTLTGDNWSDSSHTANISNLLITKINATCFSAEIHLSGFVPEHNWQQAGLLLLEDTLLTSKGIRLSLAYNSFFGGYDQEPEILVQAISSLDISGFRKPEEFAHIPIVKIDSNQRALIKNNLSNSALRVEKSGSTFRFLYSTGPLENAAFKEAAVRDFNIEPKYIGIFAIQGFVKTDGVSPVFVDTFISSPIECR